MIIISIVMMLVTLEVEGLSPECPYQNAIFCAELAVDGTQLGQIFAGPSSAGRWRFHLLADFLYLGLYATVLAGSFFRLGRTGQVAAALVVFGAALDAVENTALLLALGSGATDTLALWARSAAQLKFLLLALGISLGLALIARERERPLARIGFVIAAMACALGLAGPTSALLLEVGALAIGLPIIALTVGAFLRSRRER